MAAPGFRGGQALPVKAPTPPKAGSPGWKAFTANRWAQNHPNAGQGPAAPRAATVTPTSTAMDAFRIARAQLQQSTPLVDAAAIRAPYAASEAVTGQLGQGYLAAEQQAGQAAQTQYAQGRDLAQQHAAQFGIGSGGSAAGTSLNDTGTGALASQTAAYAAAAPAATAQWQALLERTAGAKVSAAELARAQGLTSAEQGLSASIPGAIGNEEDRGFRRHVQGFNERLAESQLGAKKASDLRRYNLDVTTANNTVANNATRNTLSQSSIDERKRHDLATEKGLATRAKRASASGVKGMPQVLSALKIASGKSGGTTKVAKGFTADLVSWDGTTEGTHIQKGIHVPRADKPPAGYHFVGTPVTHYDTVSSPGTQGGMTRAQWDQAAGIYARYNGVSRAEAMKAVQQLTPRPPK